MLNCPLYYVRGNHASVEEIGAGGILHSPLGGVDLHRQVVRERHYNLLLAGIEGSLLYNYKPYQYTQADMWWMVFQLAPRLLWNKLRFGRYLDVFVSHAPPWKIHDRDDLPHQGIRAFRWLIRVFKPAYLLHGHVHIYRQDEVVETQVDRTRVVNVYGYRVIEIHR
jgi:Icc-related predicted phosphoesterase